MKNNIYYPNTNQDFVEPNNEVNITNQDEFTPNENDILENAENLNNGRVIGKGIGQELIERKIVFNPPKKDVVVELISIDKEVKITDAEVGMNSVIVNGFVHNSIMYKTINRPHGDKDDNKDGKDNDKDNKDGKGEEGGKEDNKKDENKKDENKNEQTRPSCEILTVGAVAVDGVVRHTTVWIPFKSYIHIKGVRRGDIAEVLYATINDKDCLLGELPIYEEDERGGTQSIQVIDGVEQQQFIEGIIDKNLIRIAVIVKRS
jgi:hypothetical protein